MRYLLDTNVCIAILNGSNENIIKKIQQLSPDDIAICSIVKAELFFGAKKSQKRESNEKKLTIFFKELSSLPFDDNAAEIYGASRAYLERAGTPIGNNDLLIASIAQANDLILITDNLKEFSKIVSLKFETWSK